MVRRKEKNNQMKQKKYFAEFLLFAVFACLSSCAITKTNFVGEYTMPMEDYYSMCNLNIKSDSTFAFFIKLGLVYTRIDGTWELHNGDLILNDNTNRTLNKVDSYLRESKIHRDTDSIYIQIFFQENNSDKNKETAPFCTVCLNNEQQNCLETDIDGMIVFNNQDFNSIDIKFWGREYHFKVDSIINNIEILLSYTEDQSPYNFQNLSFQNQKVSIKMSKLYLKNAWFRELLNLNKSVFLKSDVELIYGF